MSVLMVSAVAAVLAGFAALYAAVQYQASLQPVSYGPAKILGGK